jgi:hypothetical protein
MNKIKAIKEIIDLLNKKEKNIYFNFKFLFYKIMQSSKWKLLENFYFYFYFYFYNRRF